MTCRDIRLGFSEALDAPLNGEVRRRVESHCADCAVCGPEWRSLLRLEELVADVPEPPHGFVDRIMAAIPAPRSARKETAPLLAAGLLAACALVALQLAFFSPWTAPAMAQVNQVLAGINDVLKSRVASFGGTGALTGWLALAAAIAGSISGAAILRAGKRA